MIDVDARLREAGYEYMGHTEAGHRYARPGYSVYHSGSMLIFQRDGGMTRPFNEDRLLFFTVSDMERQIAKNPQVRTGTEDFTNYDMPKRKIR